jgi:hypothetical protein
MAISRLSLLSFRPQVLKPFAALLVHAQLNAERQLSQKSVQKGCAAIPKMLTGSGLDFQVVECAPPEYNKELF